MTRDEAIQEQIDEIMDSIDFRKIHEYMVSQNWEWTSTQGIPEEYDLRKHVRYELRRLANSPSSSFNGGGFYLTKREGVEEGKPWICLNCMFLIIQSLQDGTSYDE